MAAHDWIMTFRPLAQMLRIFVLPEVESRVAAGTIGKADLPLHVSQLRLVQPGAGHRVEINDEVQLRVNVAVTRPVAAGEPLTLNDVDAEKCYLNPPLIDGKPAPYYLVQSAFLNIQSIFDFSQNAPGASSDGSAAQRMRYPIAEFVQASEFLKVIRPVEKYRQLADLNWPPAPGYFPEVLAFAHNNPGRLAEPAFADVVASAYGAELWAQRLEFWTEAQFFPERIQYIRKSVDEYLEGDWISSIYVLVPQFEGVIRDYLTSCGVAPNPVFRTQLTQLKELILSRRLLLFPRPVLELILEFIETGTFWRNTSRIGDPKLEVNRHGIAHGVFTGFETRDTALKYLILLDGLALLLLHDKTMTDRLV